MPIAKMRSVVALLLSAYLAALSCAHFVLQSPPSIGYDDSKEAQSPCGGFDISNRNTVTSFPVAGYPFSLLTTHPQSIFEYRAALLNDTSTFVDLIPLVVQSTVGYFCLGAVPGIAAWAGMDAVVQVKQSAPDGVLYQCAAVKFVSGAAAPVPSSCKNSTGVTAVFTSVAMASSTAGTGPTSTGNATRSTPTASATAKAPGAASGITVRDSVGLWAFAAVLMGAWML